MLVAAAVNVLLNICLIPYFGAMGAAISTLLAYIVLTSVSYIVNQRIYPTGFEIGPFGMKLLIGIALYVGSTFFDSTLLGNTFFGSTFLAHTQLPMLHWCISMFTLIIYGILLMMLEGLSVKRFIHIFWSVRQILAKEGNKTYA
jgi:peptidoglycan biosynthesis protein MviN/MurJ (putative lipid II flippase)